MNHRKLLFAGNEGLELLLKKVEQSRLLLQSLSMSCFLKEQQLTENMKLLDWLVCLRNSFHIPGYEAV